MPITDSQCAAGEKPTDRQTPTHYCEPKTACKTACITELVTETAPSQAPTPVVVQPLETAPDGPLAA